MPKVLNAMAETTFWIMVVVQDGTVVKEAIDWESADGAQNSVDGAMIVDADALMEVANG